MSVLSSSITFLSDEDVLLVPDSIKEKISGHIGNLRRSLESAQKDRDEARKLKDELDNALTLQREQSASKLTECSGVITDQQDTVCRLQSQLTELSEQLRSADSLATSATCEQQAAVREAELLRSDKLELSQQLERRSRDIDRLSDELDNVKTQLVEANAAKCQALLKVEDVASRETSLQFKERRIEQEKQLLQRQLDVVTQQLEEKSELLVTKRRECSSATLDLQLQLSKTQDELESVSAELEGVKSLKSDLEQRLNSQMDLLKQQRESEIEMEDNYHQQLASQTRLAQLYKESADKYESQSEMAATTVAELRQFLAQSDVEQQRVQQQIETNQQLHSEQLAARDATINQLQEQLSVCEQQLQAINKRGGLSDEAIEEMAPSAASVSRLLNSGMSLTQLFSELCRARDGETEARAELTQLRHELEQMVSDVAQRAVHVQQLRQDYQAALRTIDSLTESESEAVRESDSARLQMEESDRLVRSITVQRDKLSLQCADLSKQVCVLLGEIEEARGGIVSNTEDHHDMDTSSSHQLISSRLVVFRDIESLQKRNQELLVVVRELSDCEASTNGQLNDTDKTSTSSKQLKADLDDVRDQLKEMHCAREREMALVENLVKQRDMYRSLLRQEATSMDESLAAKKDSSSAATRSPARPVGASAQHQTAAREHALETRLAELREEYDFYKKEQAENTKLLQEQLEQHKQLLTEHRVRNVKLSSRLEYNEQKLGIVSGNCEQHRRQVVALEDKYKQTSALAAKYEQTVVSLRENAMSLQERLSRAEVAREQLERELSTAQRAEAQLFAEREALQRERTTTGVLLSSLQDIRNSLDQAHKNADMNYHNQVDTLKREVATLRSQIQQDQQRHDLASSHWTSQSADLQQQLDELTNAKTLWTQKEGEMQSLVDQLNDKISQLQQSTSSSSASISADSDAVLGSVVELHQARQQLVECRAQLESAGVRLAAADERLNQQASIARAAEARLAETDQALTECRQQYEQRLSELQSDKAELEASVATLQQQVQQENNDEAEATATAAAEAQAELEKALLTAADQSRQLDLLRQQLQDSVELQQQAASETRDENQRRLEAEERYQREVVQHAADLETVTTCRRQIDELQQKVATESGARISADTRLTELEATADRQRSQWQHDLQQSVDERQQLAKQNDVLHQQLEQFAAQLADLQTRLDPSTGGGSAAGQTPNTSFTEQDASSSEQLLEVVRYLRRQREIADTRADTLGSESQRLRVQCDSLRHQLTESSARLQQLQQQQDSQQDSAGRHEQLLRRLETLSAVTDSNRLLRREHTQLSEDNQRLQQKLHECNERLQPLQEETAELRGRSEQLEDTLKTVQAESQRWQQRTHQLTEKANKINPQEMKQLQDDKESAQRECGELQQRLQRVQHELARCRTAQQTECEQRSKLTAELQRAGEQLNQLKQTQAELSSSSKQLASLNQQHDAVKAQLDQTQQRGKQLTEDVQNRDQQLSESQQQVDMLKTQVSEKEATLNELRTANMQVKKIGRKYKTQYEELQTECGKLREQLTEASTAADQAASSSELQAELSGVRQQLEQQKSTGKEHEQKFRSVLLKFKQKLSQLTAENKQLKERSGTQDGADSGTSEADMRLSALKSQYTNRTTVLEQQLTAARSDLERAQSAEDLLKKRLVVLEKQLLLKQGKAMMMSSPTVMGDGSAACTSSCGAAVAAVGSGSSASSCGGVAGASVSRTPTANIRPMSGPVMSSCVATATGISPSSSSSSSSAASCSSTARATPTASIRPMTTPTAAVIAVVASQQGSSCEAEVSAVPVASAVPVVSVATVSPTTVASVVVTTATSPAPQSQSSQQHQLSESDIEPASSSASSSVPPADASHHHVSDEVSDDSQSRAGKRTAENAPPTSSDDDHNKRMCVAPSGAAVLSTTDAGVVVTDSQSCTDLPYIQEDDQQGGQDDEPQTAAVEDDVIVLDSDECDEDMTTSDDVTTTSVDHAARSEMTEDVAGEEEEAVHDEFVEESCEGDGRNSQEDSEETSDMYYEELTGEEEPVDDEVVEGDVEHQQEDVEESQEPDVVAEFCGDHAAAAGNVDHDEASDDAVFQPPQQQSEDTVYGESAVMSSCVGADSSSSSSLVQAGQDEATSVAVDSPPTTATAPPGRVLLPRGRGRGVRGVPGTLSHPLQRPQPIVWASGEEPRYGAGFRQLQRARRARPSRPFPR